jgi:hypothetical protein
MNIETLGYAAATYQRSPKAIADALAKINVKPTLILNGVPYFEAADIEEAMMFRNAEIVELQGQLDEIRASGVLDETAKILDRDNASTEVQQ